MGRKKKTAVVVTEQQEPVGRLIRKTEKYCHKFDKHCDYEAETWVEGKLCSLYNNTQSGSRTQCDIDYPGPYIGLPRDIQHDAIAYLPHDPVPTERDCLRYEKQVAAYPPYVEPVYEEPKQEPMQETQEQAQAVPEPVTPTVDTPVVANPVQGQVDPSLGTWATNPTGARYLEPPKPKFYHHARRGKQ